MKRMLVVEDNPDLAYGLKANLEIEGYEVDVAEDGAAGLARARAGGIDLVVLDLMLPQLDGYRVLRQLREEGFDMPVLILTARLEEADKVRGFRLGADDYVTKPFGLMELMARVAALLRRAEGSVARQPGAGPERFGDVEVHAATRTVQYRNQPVDLTPMEFDLLLALLRRRGSVASRSELLKEVWGHAGDLFTRTVDTHVAELRRKIEAEPARPRHILTVRKVGYRLAR